MNEKNLKKEIIEKINAANSPEELVETAKANGVELGLGRAKELFDKRSGEISDEELNVSGGGCGYDPRVVHAPDNVMCDACGAKMNIDGGPHGAGTCYFFNFVCPSCKSTKRVYVPAHH